MATGFMALAPELGCERSRWSAQGTRRAQGAQKKDFFGGKQKRFRGIRVGKKVFFTPHAALRERYVRWALKTLRRGEAAAAEFQLRWRELGACLDFLGQRDHKGDFIIIIIFLFTLLLFFFAKNLRKIRGGKHLDLFSQMLQEEGCCPKGGGKWQRDPSPGEVYGTEKSQYPGVQWSHCKYVLSHHVRR